MMIDELKALAGRQITWMRDINAVLGVLAAIGTIVSIVLKLDQFIQVGLFFVAATFAIGIYCRSACLRKKPIEAYESLDNVPGRYGFRDFLFLTKADCNDSVTILARTGRSWVVGRNADETKQKQERLAQAVSRGLSVDFILQKSFDHPSSRVDQRRLKAEQDEALLGLREVIRSVERGASKSGGYIKLWYADKMVTNSIIIYRTKNRFAWMIYVLDMCFGSKAVAIINSEGLANGPRAEIPEESALISEEQLKIGIGKRKVLDLANRYGGYGKRNNSPQVLLPHFAQWFRYGKDNNVRVPPPVSVQLLLTSVCVNQCIMCGHHALANKNEMSVEEVKKVLRMIASLGVNSVVISGGEPLAHKDIRDILEYAHGQVGLKVGLLTSGVGRSGAVDDELARVIYNTCDWVQVSIDSFNADTYTNIRQTGRGGNEGRATMLDDALASVKNIVGQGYRDLDICYTMQAENIADVINGCVASEIDRVVPLSVKVRFKPVHGSFNARNILPSSDEWARAIAAINDSDNGRVRDDYLQNMVQDGYFSHDDLAHGLPTCGKMEEFQNDGYKCHALNQTLLIDSNGDVYPCCYLFDDNVNKSVYRQKYLLGSVRDGRTKQVPDPNHGRNTLLEIWASNRLKQLRDAVLPIEQDACGKCTRHVRHNQCFNEIRLVYDEYYKDGIDLSMSAETPWPPASGAWV